MTFKRRKPKRLLYLLIGASLLLATAMLVLADPPIRGYHKPSEIGGSSDNERTFSFLSAFIYPDILYEFSEDLYVKGGIIGRCPSNMAPIAGGCIDTSTRGSGNWHTAVQRCAAYVVSGRTSSRLCSFSEWIAACKAGTFTPSGSYEWVDDFNQGVTMEVTTIRQCNPNIDENRASATGTATVRCCV